ncbi:hypothetical protein ACV33H_33060, partial [Pseudomonas aeruginosa]
RRLPALFEDSRVHLGALFGLLALAAVWVLAQRSFLGFQVRVLGLDRRQRQQAEQCAEVHPAVLEQRRQAAG